jgi:hypothetical protein
VVSTVRIQATTAVCGSAWAWHSALRACTLQVLSSSVVSGSDADVANSRGSGRYGGVAVTVSGVAARGVSVRSCGGVLTGVSGRYDADWS